LKVDREITEFQRDKPKTQVIRTGSMIKFKKQPREYNPRKDLLDDQLIAKAIWECLKENDPDGVIEILELI
jgi:hypothetical protein